MVAQFTAKTNSVKAIYFLSLMSCSTNKLKSYLLFTWKNFRFYKGKNNFAPENAGGVGGLAPPCPPFLYGPVPGLVLYKDMAVLFAV